jgi:phage tail sheath gpL-like
MGVPNNVIVPFFGVDFDSSMAQSGSAALQITALIIGQKLAAGTVAATTATLVSSADEVAALTGNGSNLHSMARKWFKKNQFTTTYIMALDDAAGTASTQAVTISGTATAPGELDLYVNGDRYAVAVATGDTASTIGGAVAAAINADVYQTVTAAFTGTTLTLTSKNKGIAAGDISARFNFYPGERTPAGITATIGAFTEGTVDPDIQGALDKIGGMWYQVMVGPYNDATNLGKLETYLEAAAGAMVMKDAVYYCAKKDTRSNLITFGTDASRNCKYVVTVAATSRQNTISQVAAAVAAATAQSVQEDPAVPLHRMTLVDIMPLAVTERWTLIERNQVAASGIATLSDENGVQTEATVTMYLKNAAGAADISYQYQNTVFILQRLRYTLVQRFLSKYPRAKLADSADRIRSGQQVITVDIAKAECVSWFLEEEAAGQVENVKAFKEQLKVQRSQTNPNRLDFIIPPDLINQFIVGSATMQFRLQN